jgi:DNA-directed RNA polymerase specialized sigma24 family protein
MNAPDRAALIDRARQGDQHAFHDLVGATIGEVRAFIATYVPTANLGEALLRECYGAIRRELERCPLDDISGWMCRTSATLISVRLAEVTGGGAAERDPLIHLVAERGALALSQNTSGENPAVVELPRRLQMQPPSLRQLLQRHYQEGLTVATIAEKQGLVEGEVAQALLAARARMDWTGMAEVGDTADQTYPSILEDFLAGTLVPDARALLTAGVIHDEARGVQFERQVRLHLLLQVLFTPLDGAAIKDLIASLPSARNDSSRLIMAPRTTRGGTSRITASAKTGAIAKSTSANQPASDAKPLADAKPGSGPRPRGEPTRTRRQITETGPGTQGFTKSASGASAQVAAPDDLGEDAPKPPNRLPLYLGAGAAGLGLLILAIMLLSPAKPVEVVTTRTDIATPTAPLGDPGFAIVHQAEGQTVIRHAGLTRPAAAGEALSPGDALELTGTGTLGALVADQVRMTLRADSQATGIALNGQVLELQVPQGRVQLDHRRGTRVASLLVRTPHSQTALADASALIEVVEGVTRVQIGRGTARIARPDGAGAVEGKSGGVVLVRAGVNPAVDGGGTYVRGINFGDGVVTIERNQWLSLTEALGAGLTLGAGVRLGPPVQMSGPGMDFDSKRMLDAGLVGEGGQVELTQVLPNGDYDLSMWVAGAADATFDGLSLSIGNQAVPLGPPAAKAERWRRLGPLRVAVKEKSLALRLSGLNGAHLAGLELDSAGPLQESLPPMILITDPTSGSEVPALDLVIRTRADAAGGIAKVAFYNRDELLGEATTPPFSYIWKSPAVGPFALSAVATDSAGGSSRSVVIQGEVQDSSKLTGFMRETWRRVGGGAINDLRKHLNTPPTNVELVPHSDHEISGNDFGVRLRGYLKPPVDGEYRLEVCSDDQSEVWLSPDENPANRRLVCHLYDYAGRDEWAKNPSQRSQPVNLEAGKRYFIEVLYKQGGGGAHLRLGWVVPGGATERPIPPERFSPALVSGSLPPANAPTPATPTPNPVAPATPVVTGPPAIVPRSIPQTLDGPLLRGSIEASGRVANLSDLGMADWIHYGIKDDKSVTRRQGEPQLLSVAVSPDNAEIKRYGDNRTFFGWNNGAPIAVAAGTNTGWFTANKAKGFSFTAPADPVLRRLMVWVGGHDTHANFTATLSDGSAPPYRDGSITVDTSNGWYCYTLLYRARTSGAKLTITYASDKANDGNVTLQAVALTEFSDGKARFIRGINLGGDSAVIAGNQWIAQKDAETNGLIVQNSRRVSGSAEPTPAASDAGMKAMLRSGVAAKSGELEIHDRGLPNGRYDVTVYVCETATANRRLFDVTINDATLSDVGQLAKNAWAAYGPVTATVTKGVLSLTTKSKKGLPQIMGITLHTPRNPDGPWTNAFPAGRPHALPGTLLFADFDRGTNGGAFFEREATPRNPFYRPDPVGINQYHGAPVVAYVPNGEWLRYTVQVMEPGTYTITVKYAKANGADPRNARVAFEIDGQAVGGELRLEDTQRWDTAKTVTSQPFALTAGLHDLRALFAGEQDEIGDFWSMEFKKL